MIAGAMLVAALGAPDSLALARAEGEAFAMLSRLFGATRAAVVAVDRTRASAGDERRVPRDSALADPTWVARLRDELRALPPADCPRVPILAGQRYPFLFLVAPQMPGEPSAIELDFRGPCARLVRAGEVVAGRSFRGREGAIVALLAEVLPRDRALARLAGRYAPSMPATPALPFLEPARDTLAELDAGPRPARDAFTPVDQMARIVTQAMPSYPEEARRRGIQGVVFIRALIGRSGRVIDAVVEKSVPALDEAAMDAVFAYRFEPARRDGEPVMTWITVPVRFTLR